jgi:hypothetical protein
VRRWGAWALLIGVVTAVWLTHYGRWSPSAWSVPPHYSGDSLEILARIAAAAEAEGLLPVTRRLTRLAAPLGADWTEYPASDRVLIAALGAVAAVAGTAVASNLAVWLATVSAAASFYACARWLRHDRAWSWAGAVLFAFLPQSFGRGLEHLLMAFTWTVPPALLSCWLVATGRVALRRGGVRWFVLGTSMALGVSNPYLLVFYGQLLVLAAGVRACRERSWRGLLPGAMALAVAALAFVAVHWDYLLLGGEERGTPLVARNYGGTERYALKPMELVLPPAHHRWDALAFFGLRYVRWSDWRGETFMAYLGLIGAAALAWMMVEAFVRLAVGRRLSAHAPLAIWVLLYSSVGGLTNFVAFFTGVHEFRAANRFSVFLAALVFFFAVSRLTRISSRWPAIGRWGLAGVVAVLGVLDLVPPRPGPEVGARIAARWHSDRVLAEVLEAQLAKGAAVFQLPVLEFPEAAVPAGLADYFHFAPFLHAPTLRFSYGGLKWRARDQWQQDLADSPPALLVPLLEQAGFAAVLVHRPAYPDQAGPLLFGLAAAGAETLTESPDGAWAALRLQPAGVSRPLLARSPVYGRGWHRPEESEGVAGRRWAYERASWSYFNPREQPVRVQVEFRLISIGARTIVVRAGAREIYRHTFGGDETVAVEWKALELAPGLTRIDFATDRPGERRREWRGRLQAFGVEDVLWVPQEP